MDASYIRHLPVALLAIVVCLLAFVPMASAAAPAFTPVPGSPFNIDVMQGVAPSSVAYSPNGQLLAVGDTFTPGIAIFGVTRATGALTEEGTQTDATSDVENIAWSPTGDLLASVEHSGDIVIYSVDQANGTLSAWTGILGSCAESVAFNPNGNSIAVARNCMDGTSAVQIYTVDRNAMTLEADGSAVSTAGHCPSSVQYSPNGALLAVGNNCDDSTDGVQLFTVNATNGRVTSLKTTLTGSDSCPNGVAFSPNSDLLAVPLSCGTTIDLFSVNATTGTLTSVATPADADCPNGADFDSAGGLLAVVGGCYPKTVSVFSVTSGGSSVSAVSGSPYSPVDSSEAIAFAPGGGTIAIADDEIGTVGVLALASPTATISVPGPGLVYTTGQHVASAFSCADAALGPGISACTDSNGAAGSGSLDTATTGSHAYTVTATSGDGLSSQSSLEYTVVGPPRATIKAPASRRVYPVGAKIRTAFSCTDGAGAPGLAACVGSNGAAAGGRTIVAAVPGRYSFSVTAFSEDGAVVTSRITYTVAARPTITISKPAKNAKYPVGTSVKVRFACHDGRDGPGIAKCTGTVRAGGALDTMTAGKRTFTVKATSKDGQTVTYRVSYLVVTAG